MLTATSSQKQGVRPISFALDNAGAELTTVGLYIRPEELTRHEPSRLTVQQTLGSPWIDNFGPGIQQLAINGHTGWKGPDGGPDGMTLFKELNVAVFKQWHALRQQAVNNGTDPNSIRLLFVDVLDDFVWEVAALSFTLRRSRSRPLLMQFQINMVAIDASLILTRGSGAADDATTQALAADSLSATIAKLNTMATDIAQYLDATVGAPTRALMQLTGRVLNKVMAVTLAAKGVIDATWQPLLGAAANLARAGRNVGAILAAAPGLVQYAQWRAMQVAAAFTNADCILRNALRLRGIYPDYSSIYGSSICSSTSGGNPLSPYLNVNTFEQIVPTVTPPILVNSDAQASIAYLANLDVQRGTTNADLAAHLNLITNGVTVAP